MTILPDLSDLVIEQISMTNDVTVTVHAASPTASETAKAQERPSSPARLENVSAPRATWLFLRKLDDLDETEQEELALMRQASPSCVAAYRLTQAFLRMIRERTGEGLDRWLDEAEESHLPEFESFATGVRKDKAAVLAGLTLP